jgi:hypothetical protein
MKRLLTCLLCAFAFQATAAAHVLDEYVQAAKIMLAPDGVRVELRLTPGVEIAGRVFAMIDVDGNGQISPAEEQAYARRVLQDIALEMDGRREKNEGTGAIRLDLKAETGLGAAGDHQLYFRNDHLPELSVYLVNVLVPTTSEIKISGQERDPLQHEMRLSFHVTPQVTPRVIPADTHRPWPWTGALMLCLCLLLLFLLWKYLRQYLRRHNDKQIPDSPAR